MAILIENYRGHDIFFEPSSERFTCLISTGNLETKESFASTKKFVDDYIKKNESFIPFLAQEKYSGDTIRISGIRKDGRFIFEQDGKLQQLSDYHVRNYILYKEENDKFFTEIKSIKAEIRGLEEKIRAVGNKIITEPISYLKEKYKSL